jgi:proline iminopeptidase
MTSKYKPLKIVGWMLLAGLLAWVGLTAIPRTYAVPDFQPLPGTQYWTLSDGARIGYTRIEARTATQPYPIVYLHGGPGGYIHEAITLALQPLAESGYTLYLYDQRGSGASDRMDDLSRYTVAQHRQDLEEVLEQIGAERVILVAQSWGAILANFFAAANPDKIQAIVLTSPGPIYPVDHRLADLAPPDSLQLRAPAFSNADGNKKVQNWRSKTAEFVARAWSKKWMPDSEADAFFAELNTALNRSTCCDAAKALKSGKGGGYYAHICTVNDLHHVSDPRNKLKNIQAPVLVLKGQCDNQKWGFTQEYLTVFPNASLKIIPGAGHSMYIEQAENYRQAILDFLRHADR